MNIGTAVKNIRQKKGLSQTDLSKLCGLSQTSLSHIEKGVKRPSSTSVKRIAEALGVPEPLLYLYGMEETDIVKEKLFMYQRLFPTIQNLIMELVDD